MPRDVDAILDHLLRQVVAHTNDVVLITRAVPKEGSGREIVFVNRAFERLFGYSAAEAVGRTPRMLEGPKTDPGARARMRAALAGRRQIHEQILNYAKDGRAIWVDVNMVPLTDPSGAVAFFAAIERDITADRQLLEQTLAGSVRLLMDVLVAYDPVTFKDSLLVRGLAKRIGEELGVRSLWELDIAATLFMLGVISVPRAVMHRWQSGETLDDGELAAVRRIPEVGAKLLADVPRLTAVSQIVLYQDKRFDGGGFPADTVQAEAIPQAARILALAKGFIHEIESGDSPEHVVAAFRRDAGRFDPAILEQAAAILLDFNDIALRAGVVVEALPHELRHGDELIDKIVNSEGTMILGAGFVLTEAILDKLRLLRRTMTFRTPIRVRRR